MKHYVRLRLTTEEAWLLACVLSERNASRRPYPEYMRRFSEEDAREAMDRIMSRCDRLADADLSEEARASMLATLDPGKKIDLSCDPKTYPLLSGLKRGTE